MGEGEYLTFARRRYRHGLADAELGEGLCLAIGLDHGVDIRGIKLQPLEDARQGVAGAYPLFAPKQRLPTGILGGRSAGVGKSGVKLDRNFLRYPYGLDSLGRQKQHRGDGYCHQAGQSGVPLWDAVQKEAEGPACRRLV